MECLNKSFYAVIPANVRYCKELNANAKLLYGEITALTNEKGYCWATNSYFAELYGVSKTSISNWISNLEKQCFIQIEIIKDSKTKQVLERRIYIDTPIKENFNTYTRNLDDPIKENFNTYTRNLDDPIKENFKENNTLFNNTFNNNKKEKYKKEKKKSEFDLLIDDYSENEELKKAIYDFIVMRKTIKKPLTTRALKQILNKLDEYAKDDNTKIKILDQSIEHCWQSIYQLKENNNYQDYSKKGVSNAGTTDKTKQTYKYGNFDSNDLPLPEVDWSKVI